MSYRFLTATLLAMVLFTSVSHAETETAFDRILRTGVLHCGYGINPPYVAKDPNSGALSGIQYDVVNEIGKRLQLKIEWTTEAGFSTAVADLQGAKYDMFCSGLTPTGLRSKFVDFTSPPFFAPFDVWVRKDDHRFDAGLETLNAPSVKMAVIEGNLMAMIHDQTFPQSQKVGLVSVGDENIEMLLGVSTGKTDFTVMERTTGENFIAKNPDTLRRLGDKPVWVVPYAYPVMKGETKLQQMINTTLIEMQSTGALNRILDAHKAEAPNLLRLPPLYASPQ